ncbi:hypothetical protein Q8F55_005040 [Vanrija albida]|uniref:Uncharacterized protein n=1 Tax=Vanrija albida TaxID=181172 RepID=A0ABR3Q0I1_9TREE
MKIIRIHPSSPWASSPPHRPYLGRSHLSICRDALAASPSGRLTAAAITGYATRTFPDWREKKQRIVADHTRGLRQAGKEPNGAMYFELDD